MKNNDDKNIASLKVWHEDYKHLLGLMILILSMFIWCPKVFAGANYSSQEKCYGGCRHAWIGIYAGPSPSPDTCANGMWVGMVYVDFDFSDYVHKHHYDDVLDIVPSGSWHHEQSWDEWWTSQLNDTSTSYCGIVHPISDIAPFPEEDLRSLRGTYTLEKPALKLTIQGAYVKVDPLHACCTPEGEFVEQLIWGKEECEPNESAGKFSNRHHCEPSEQPPDHPDQPGACHLTCPNPWGKKCKMMTRQECVSRKGVFAAEEECPPGADCPKEGVGCCIQRDCDQMPPEICDSFYGVPLPGQRQCSGNYEADCGDFTGACMVGDDCKEPYTEAECRLDLKGEYQGPDKTCEPDKVACCDTKTGGCDFVPKEKCTGENKTISKEPTCEPNSCEPPGHCCDKGECTKDPEDECNGIFFPDGCPAVCPEVGACYISCPHPDNKEACLFLTREECKEACRFSARAECENHRSYFLKPDCDNQSDLFFKPNEKCPPMISACPGWTCSRCGPVCGLWKFASGNESSEMNLKADYTGTMLTTREVSGSEWLERSSMSGDWECIDEKVTINWGAREEDKETKRFKVKKPELTTKLDVVCEGETQKLCYEAGGEVVCFERKQMDNDHKVIVNLNGIYPSETKTQETKEGKRK